MTYSQLNETNEKCYIVQRIAVLTLHFIPQPHWLVYYETPHLSVHRWCKVGRRNCPFQILSHKLRTSYQKVQTSLGQQHRQTGGNISNILCGRLIGKEYNMSLSLSVSVSRSLFFFGSLHPSLPSCLSLNKLLRKKKNVFPIRH